MSLFLTFNTLIVFIELLQLLLQQIQEILIKCIAILGGFIQVLGIIDDFGQVLHA